MSASRRLLTRVADSALLAAGLVSFTVAGFLVALPLGFAVLGVSFVAMDLASDDRGEA